jgi:hypothetical protein
LILTYLIQGAGMNMRLVALIFGFAGALVIEAPCVLASGVSPGGVTYSGNLQYSYSNGTLQLGSPTNPFIGQDIHLSGSAVSSATANATVNLAVPTLGVSGSVDGPASAVSDSNLQLSYQFEVLGTLSGLVPVAVSAFGLANSTGAFVPLLQASLHITGNAGDIINQATNGAGSWTVNGSYQFQANQLYTVLMGVTGVAETGGAGGASTYSATVDPMFDIVDPNFIGLYTLEFSPGILNASAAPEPSTWAMMILGFAGIGAMTYHRRKSAMLSLAA